MAVNIDYSAGRGQAGMLQNLLNIQQQGYQQMAAKERQKQEQLNQLFRAGGGFLQQRRAEGEARDIAALDAQTQQALQSAEADYLAGLQKYNASLEEAGSFEQKKAVREDLENFMKSYQAQRSAIARQAEERKKAYYDTGFLGIGRDAGTLGGEFNIPGLYSAEGMGDITKAPSEEVAAAQAGLSEAEQLKRRAQQKAFMDAEYLSRQALRDQSGFDKQQEGILAKGEADISERKRMLDSELRGLLRAEERMPIPDTANEEDIRSRMFSGLQKGYAQSLEDKVRKEKKASEGYRKANVREANKYLDFLDKKYGEGLDQRELIAEAKAIADKRGPEAYEEQKQKIKGEFRDRENKLMDRRQEIPRQISALNKDFQSIQDEFDAIRMGAKKLDPTKPYGGLKHPELRNILIETDPAKRGELLQRIYANYESRIKNLQNEDEKIRSELRGLGDEESARLNEAFEKYGRNESIKNLGEVQIEREARKGVGERATTGAGSGLEGFLETAKELRESAKPIDEANRKRAEELIAEEQARRVASASDLSAASREQKLSDATKMRLDMADKLDRSREDFEARKLERDKEAERLRGASTEALTKAKAGIEEQKGFLAEAKAGLSEARDELGEDYVQLPSGRYVKRSGTASAMEEEKRLKLRGEAREDRLEALSLDLARNSDDPDAVNAFMEANDLPEGFRLMLDSTVQSNAYKKAETEADKQKIILKDTYNRLVALGQFEQAFEFGQENDLIGKNVKYTDNKAIEQTKEMVRTLSDENEASKILDQAGITGADRELHMAIVRQNKGKSDTQKAINLSNSPALSKKQRFDVLKQAFPKRMSGMTFQQYENVDEQLNAEFQRASVTGGSLSPELFERLGIRDAAKKKQMNDFATRSYYDSVYEKDRNMLLLELEGALSSSDVMGEDGKMIPSRAMEVVNGIISTYPGAAKHFGYDSKYFKEKLITDTKNALAAERFAVSEATLKQQKLIAEVAKAEGKVLPSDFFDAASKTWSNVYSRMIEDEKSPDVAAAAANSAVFFMRQGLSGDAKGGYEGVVNYLKEMGFLVDQVPNKTKSTEPDGPAEKTEAAEKQPPDNRTLAEFGKQVSKAIGENVRAAWDAATGTIYYVTDSGKVITERMIYDFTGGLFGKSAKEVARERAAQ